MPNFTGNLKSDSTSQTTVSLNDTPGHILMMVNSQCVQTSSDNRFNNLRHFSCGTADLIQGSGPETGYFTMTNANGDRCCGKYTGQISTTNGVLSSQGTWEFTHGTGEFNGISGSGNFKARMPSPAETEVSFDGTYQVKAGTRAA